MTIRPTLLPEFYCLPIVSSTYVRSDTFLSYTIFCYSRKRGKNLVNGWKTQSERKKWWSVYLYHKINGEAEFLFCSRFTDKYLRYLFDLNFVISGKVTSLPRVIKYMKRSKYYFHYFSAKHTQSAPLNNFLNMVFFCQYSYIQNLKRYIDFLMFVSHVINTA